MQTEHASTASGADDLDLLDAEATSQPATKSETVPDKYAGKTVDDLIKMHQNAEKVISRQGQEVSQVRRMADEILNLKKPETQKTEAPHTPITVDALLNDPEKAIRDAVANSDMGRRAQSAEERTAHLEAQLAEQAFVAKHKDFAQDVNDPEFLAWVSKNPLRQALANETAKKNFRAADNLWSLWDEHKELVGEKAEAPKKQVPSGVKSAPAENRAKTVYSRAKLMELRMKVEDGDPAATARWKDQTFQNNLIQAYADGRVR